jgi:hypothetical protein
MKPAFRALYRYWMAFARVLGWINGRIILTIMYIFIIGPYAIVRKIGSIFMRKRIQETFWIKRDSKDHTLESLRQIF